MDWIFLICLILCRKIFSAKGLNPNVPNWKSDAGGLDSWTLIMTGNGFEFFTTGNEPMLTICPSLGYTFFIKLETRDFLIYYNFQLVLCHFDEKIYILVSIPIFQLGLKKVIHLCFGFYIYKSRNNSLNLKKMLYCLQLPLP